MLNNDISQGSLTDSQIVSIFGPDGLININPEDVKKLRDQVSGLFTVNQYVTPLNPQKLPSLAAEAAFSLNYFDNYLKSSYIYRGEQYSSFGQSYVRTDVAGINVLDRLRLFENKFFVSVGYESLQDNLQKIKRATTTFQTLNTSVSFYPRTNLPSIIVGYTRLNNTNGLSPIKDPTDSTAYLSAINDITNRISTQLSYNFEWHYRHSISLSFVNSTRDDKSHANYDIENSSVTVSSGTRWFDNLSSSLNISMNNSKVDTTSFGYVSIALGANYSMMQDKLLLSGSLSPSFGDYIRTSFDASALYYLMPNLTLQLQFRYLNYDYTSSKIDQNTNIQYAVKTKANDVIMGLTTQLYLQ